jgi:hypothetical protein
MPVKSKHFEIRDMSQMCPLLSNSLLKHISMTFNMHTTAEELLGVVFSNQPALELYKDSQHHTEAADSSSAWGYNWATLYLRDINMGTWTSRLGGVSNLRQ